jgi:hypothetical protein
MDRLRRAFIGRCVRTVLAEEFGLQGASFTVPANWDYRATNEYDLAFTYVIAMFRRELDQVERDGARCIEADVWTLLRCQQTTFRLAKYAMRGTDGLVGAWQEIQARTERLLRQPEAVPLPAALSALIKNHATAFVLGVAVCFVFAVASIPSSPTSCCATRRLWPRLLDASW